ncbi:DUF4870 family protein [Photobacterium kishitanii]|uniref:Transmembrane protein n=1 Tax=Photobacterium kishitanii TaxID=318456 RepID=A0A2T3KL63_9GAMM|nr:hypothetical protein [Photobacterium kishitanii]PSV00390.1 hypothetical protein C9J27_04480 [Photobacterium kishitanii]
MINDNTIDEDVALNDAPSAPDEPRKSRVMLSYLIALISLLVSCGLFCIIPLIMAHLGTSKDSIKVIEPLDIEHFRYIKRTLWFGLLWMVVGTAGLFIAVGALVIIATWIWMMYRIIKGITRYSDHQHVLPENLR